MTTINPMKRVRFHPSVQIVEVMSIEDYQPCEIEAAWYNEVQMEKITNRAFKVIKSMDAGRGRKYCIRGLEGHSHLGSISKKRNRTAAMAAVLTEQAQQWVDHSFDDQAIADAYHRTTTSCQMWAQAMGNKDRQVADAVLCQDEEEYMEELRIAAEAFNASKQLTLEKSKECSFPSTSRSSSPKSVTSQVVNAARKLSPVRSSRGTARLIAVH